MADRFPFLRSDEAEPKSVWSWAYRIVELLNKSKLSASLDDISLKGKAGYTIKVKADESGFEIVP